VSAADQTIPPPSGSRRAKDLAFRLTLLACLGISILLLGVLLYDVIVDGAGHLDLDFLTSFTSISADKAGAQAAIWGTIWLMGICAVFIVPVGVATAIYLEEYADNDKWFNRLIEVNIQNLAAVPSIVYGILGLAFLVRGPLSLGNTVLAGGLTLGLLVLPVVIISGREAIRAVPPSIREGSMALCRHRRDPGALTRDRGDRAADRGRRRHRDRLQPRRPRLPVHGAADPDLRLDLTRVQ
jgi:phosphate transport system permease protein